MYDLNDQQKEDLIRQAQECSDRDISAEVMSELLMDTDWSTWKMFEGLATDYLWGNADVRKGIDQACAALTGWELGTIAQMIIDRCNEYGVSDGDDEDTW